MAAVTMGRLVLFSSNQRKIELSRTVRERVVAALALSPDDDVALHILGRWEYEMSSLGFAVRLAVKALYGGMEQGNLGEAHRCLARAIQIRPDRLVHRVVMARILLKQGRKEEAISQLEVALTLRVEDVNASHERAEALRIMAKLGRTPPVSLPQPLRRVVSWAPPPPPYEPSPLLVPALA
jgi:tetratricopeptide (TPR) repeat protein